jgi:hypothetical protein
MSGLRRDERLKTCEGAAESFRVNGCTGHSAASSSRSAIPPVVTALAHRGLSPSESWMRADTRRYSSPPWSLGSEVARRDRPCFKQLA